MEAARKTRRQTHNQAINQTAVAHNQKWDERAKSDPEWAQENPVRLLVNKSGLGSIF